LAVVAGLLAASAASGQDAASADVPAQAMDATLADAAGPAEAGPDAGLGAGDDPADPTGLDALALAPPVATFAPVERGPERWTIPEGVLAAVREARNAPLGVRMEAASRSFLGLPYLNDAAGELDAIDPDPPSRYDTFDCLTFVEEVLGLALAGDPLHAPMIRDALRYRGKPSYATRRHFMEAWWIPDAIRNGLVTDITARVGRARTLRKSVTHDMWRHWAGRRLFRLPDDALPVGDWSLDYLDLEEAVAAVPRIPHGALLVTVRADRPWKPIVVTHISVVVPPAADAPPGAEARMRHATRMGRRLVRDDRLGWYAAHIREYSNWPALGITVLLPREQGPRISALAPIALPVPFPSANEVAAADNVSLVPWGTGQASGAPGASEAPLLAAAEAARAGTPVSPVFPPGPAPEAPLVGASAGATPAPAAEPDGHGAELLPTGAP
jgi:hypothetical protein